MPALPLKNVLVVFKKSRYQIYFVERSGAGKDLAGMSAEDLQKLKEADEAHRQTLAFVDTALHRAGIRHRLVYRARHTDHSRYDFAIAVGGDGTLIEAARWFTGRPILGVNSDPKRSVGFFCAAQTDNFEDMLAGIQAGTVRTMNLNRMSLKLNGQKLCCTAINDLLIAHHRPAAMSRYLLQAGEVSEMQNGSGLWVSTAAGSTGAIHSAGGKRMPARSLRLQYRPRELFRGYGDQYRLTGGFLPAGVPLAVESHMRDGEIYIDGCRCRVPFGFGSRLEISNSPNPLELVIGGHEKIQA